VLQSLVLGILARRETYGYEVAAQLRAVDEGFELAEGSVYPALRRLEHSGLATSRWVEIGAEVPRRRYYAVTPKGLAALARQRPLSGPETVRHRLGTARP
jgi:DNA-binding PadR family transcriptional regulator